jgi:hypothetical protein
LMLLEDFEQRAVFFCLEVSTIGELTVDDRKLCTNFAFEVNRRWRKETALSFRFTDWFAMRALLTCFTFFVAHFN